MFTPESIKTKDDFPAAVIAAQTITERDLDTETLLAFIKPFYYKLDHSDCLRTVEC